MDFTIRLSKGISVSTASGFANVSVSRLNVSDEIRCFSLSIDNFC